MVGFFKNNAEVGKAIEYKLGRKKGGTRYVYITNEKYPTFHSKSTPLFSKKIT